MRRSWSATGLAFGACSFVQCDVASEDTGYQATELGMSVPLVPTGDVERTNVSADGNTTTLYTNLDDGTSFAAADTSTTVRNSWSASTATYTASYANGPASVVGSIAVNYRATGIAGVAGTIQIKLYNGATLIGTGAAHALGASYANFTDAFSNLNLASGTNLRTQIVFKRPGTTGYLRCTQIWIVLNGGASASNGGTVDATPPAAGTEDAGAGVDAGSNRGGAVALVTDPNSVFSVPAIGKPGYLGPITPAPFGTRITRITGDPTAPFTFTSNGTAGVFGSEARQHYQKDQPWSSDGALLALQNQAGGSPSVVYLDGETYAPRFGRCSNYALGDDRWHPSRLHPRERINVKGSTISWFDVAACAVTRSWSLPLTASYFGSGEGNPSFDGRFAALGDASHIVVVDMDPAPPLPPYPAQRVGPVRDISDCGLASGCSVDWVSVSPSGKYVVVSYNGDYPRVFTVDPTTLALTPRPMPTAYPTCKGDIKRGFIYELGHADMTQDPFDAGEDVLIGQEHCGNVGKTVAGQAIGHVVKVRLRDGAITSLTRPTNEAYAHHVSARSYDRPGWVYVGYYPAPGQRFDDEIVAIKIDGTQTVERLAHKHSAFSGCYRCESHAVPSRDGRRVVFASNWAATCGSACGKSSSIQAYVLDTRTQR